MVLVGVHEQVSSEILKEQLFASPPLISAKISPDGKTIAYVGADEAGISNVFIGSMAESVQITFFKTPDIIQFFWSGDSRRVLVLKDDDGTGRLHLHGINIHSKEHVVYTEKFSNVSAKMIQVSSVKNSAVIALNPRNPYFHDLYVVDLDTGKLELLFENDHYAKFLLSDQLELILKMRINDDGSWTVLTADNDVFLELSPSEAFQTEFLSYNEKKLCVYLLDNRFSDMNQLIAKSLDGPREEMILGAPSDSDVDDVLFIAGEPKAYASYYVQKKWHAIDPSIESDIAFLKEKMGPNFDVLSTSDDGNVWVVIDRHPDKGGQFRIYNRKVQDLSSFSAAQSSSSFSKMYPLIAEARDGTKLVCYYTLPKEFDKGGAVDAPIPLVVVPHGGPFKARDKFEFNLWHQWLASCGYAVLSVNFRLSSGFGKAFVNAGNGQWGGKAHDDVIDAVECCIAKGITERGKLAVFGGSYGGYEALASLAFSPEYFTCCVSICGPSNLKTVLDNVPQFWEFTPRPLSDKMNFFTKKAFITSMGGNPDDPEGVRYLEKCSPINALEAITAPLLLIHGKNDHIVAEKESEQIYQSMKNTRKAVTYVVFPDEGHRIAKFPNKMMYLNQAEQFLSQHLGGKHRPVDPHILESSSAQILD